VIPLLSLLLGQVDLPWIVAGHGYDVGTGAPRNGAEVDDEESGIGARWIVAAVLVAVIAAGALVALDPSAARRKLSRLGPRALVLVLITAPLVVWTASAGGDDDPLTVERTFDVDGKPELLVALGDEKLNTLAMTDGKRAVRVECVGRDGDVVVASPHRWPFVDEVGFDAPHAHQPGSRDDVERVDRCRLLGTREQLEAEVKGVLVR
jgi:hypothetical protein